MLLRPDQATLNLLDEDLRVIRCMRLSFGAEVADVGVAALRNSDRPPEEVVSMVLDV